MRSNSTARHPSCVIATLLISHRHCLLDRQRRARTVPHTVPIALRYSTHRLLVSRSTLIGSTVVDVSNLARTLSRSIAISIAQPTTLLEWSEQLCHRAFLSPTLRIRSVSIAIVDEIYSIFTISAVAADVLGESSTIESGLLPVSHWALHQSYCHALSQLGNSQSRELHLIESSRFPSVEISAARSIVERLQNED